MAKHALKKLAVGAAAAVAATTSGLAIGAQPATAALSNSVVFNKPLGTAAEKATIINHLIGLINGAAAGSSIKLSIYSFYSDSVTNALLAAKNRGVNVQVVGNDTNADNPPFMRLTAASGLGSDKSKSSWAMICTKGAACIGKVGTPINHNKFAIFSNTSGSTNVVWQSTGNLNGSSGTDMWNSTVTTVANTPIYNSYAGYFADLAAMRKSSNYFDVRPPVDSGDHKAYFFPSADNDPVLNVLGNVACKGNTTGGTSEDHRTIVRVGMGWFTRSAVAQKLFELDKAGCYVDIVYTRESDGVRNALTQSAGAYNGPRVRTFSNEDHGIHSKYLLVEGAYNGVVNRKVLWVGSHNFTNPALRENDETLLKIDDAGVHDKFRQNFGEVAGAANVTVASGTRTRAFIDPTTLPPTIPDDFDENSVPETPAP